jgi:hypothetical protein
VSTADRLAKIERKMNDAARELQPLMIGGDVDTARAAHDALNALASAMIEVGLLQMDTETTTEREQHHEAEGHDAAGAGPGYR